MKHRLIVIIALLVFASGCVQSPVGVSSSNGSNFSLNLTGYPQLTSNTTLDCGVNGSCDQIGSTIYLDFLFSESDPVALSYINANQPNWSNQSTIITCNPVNEALTSDGDECVSIVDDDSTYDLHLNDITGNPHNVTLEQARTANNTLGGAIEMNDNGINNISDINVSEDKDMIINVGSGGHSFIKVTGDTLEEQYRHDTNASKYSDLYQDYAYYGRYIYGDYTSFFEQYHNRIGFGIADHNEINVYKDSLNVSKVINISVLNGTAPLAVNSTTVNANLNADMLDGIHGDNITNLESDNSKMGQLSTIYINSSGIPTKDNYFTAPYPYNGTIVKVQIVSNVNGSLNLSAWKDSEANYPPTIADIISPNNFNLTETQLYVDTTLIGWNTDVNASDIFTFNIRSGNISITQFTATLFIRRD